MSMEYMLGRLFCTFWEYCFNKNYQSNNGGGKVFLAPLNCTIFEIPPFILKLKQSLPFNITYRVHSSMYSRSKGIEFNKCLIYVGSYLYLQVEYCGSGEEKGIPSLFHVSGHGVDNQHLWRMCILGEEDENRQPQETILSQSSQFQLNAIPLLTKVIIFQLRKDILKHQTIGSVLISNFLLKMSKFWI